MPRLLLNFSQTSVPQRITGSFTPFRNATFFGVSGFTGSVPVNNTSNAYIGISSGECIMLAAPGASFAYTIPTLQERDNLGNWWVNGRANDGIYIIYN